MLLRCGGAQGVPRCCSFGVVLPRWSGHRRFAAEFHEEEPRIFPGARRSQTRQGLELPEGWRQFQSPSRGVYYGHTSGATRFDFPTGPPSKDEVHRAQQERKERYEHRSDELSPGAPVRLVGLDRFPHLEGKAGTCVQLDPDGYVRVRLASGELKAVKRKNLMLVRPRQPSMRSQHQEPAAKGRRRWPMLMAASGLGAFAVYFLYQQQQARAVCQKQDTAEKLSAALPPLPEGWREHLDPASGRPYYWREADPKNSVTWERPAAAK